MPVVLDAAGAVRAGEPRGAGLEQQPERRDDQHVGHEGRDVIGGDQAGDAEDDGPDVSQAPEHCAHDAERTPPANPVGPGVHPRPSSERALGAARVSVIAEVHALEHPRHECHGREADDDVDHVGDGSGPQDLLDDVEVEEGHQGPVESAEQDEREPHRLEPLDEFHRILL